MSAQLRGEASSAAVSVDAEDTATRTISRGQIISWPHPKHYGKTVKLLVLPGAFLEINTLAPADAETHPTSWFIENSVSSHGALYLATPVDPLLLALPWLAAARGRAAPTAEEPGRFALLAQVFLPAATGHACTPLLLDHFLAAPAAVARLRLVCTVSGEPSAAGSADAGAALPPQLPLTAESAVRLSDELVLALLTRKVAKTAAAMAALPAFAPATSTKASDSNSSSALTSTDAYTGRRAASEAASGVLAAALGFASEYLTPAMTETLLAAFTKHDGAPFAAADISAPSGGAGAAVNESGVLTADREIMRDPAAAKRKSAGAAGAEKQTAGDRARAKLAQSAVGTKSIASFFKKL